MKSDIGPMGWKLVISVHLFIHLFTLWSLTRSIRPGQSQGQIKTEIFCFAAIARSLPIFLEKKKVQQVLRSVQR